MNHVREALGSLTLRGRCFVAAGATAAACGVLMGERDLVRIGLLVILLPLATAVWVARSGSRLGLSRTLSADQVEVGQHATARLEVTNVGPTTGTLLVEERLPAELGEAPRFVIDTMRPGWRRRVDYPLSGVRRGRYEIGPLEVTVGDPFGMLQLRRTFTRTAPFVVIPRIESIPAVSLHGAWTGTGDNRPRPFASGGAADVTVREYRLGDDLRRVHWRSTARVGQLMVRREEQPWQSRCTLVLDNRAASHRGIDAESSLEAAVSATASIAVHLAHLGYRIRLVSAEGEELGHGWHEDGAAVSARPLLERLAVLRASRDRDLDTTWVDETVTHGTTVAVLGSATPHDQAFWARIPARGGAAYAVVLDVDTWPRMPGQSAPSTPATDWLRQHGWKAATWRSGEPVGLAWQGLGR